MITNINAVLMELQYEREMFNLNRLFYAIAHMGKLEMIAIGIMCLIGIVNAIRISIIDRKLNSINEKLGK